MGDGQRIPTGPWESEPELTDESDFTPGGEGWSAWNGMSPEKEYCEFGAALVSLLRPRLIVETGIGQGYMTRRLLAVKTGRYVGYESDDDWRARLRDLDVWDETAELASEPEPSPEVLAACDLAVIDSWAVQRLSDIDLWRKHAPAGGYVLIHDARPDHPSGGIWQKLAEYLGDEGVFLGNPRGSWLYRKPLTSHR